MDSARRSSHAVEDEAISVFWEAGAPLRTSQLLARGVHPRALRRMWEKGLLERLDRGLYRLANLPNISDPDLVIVAARVPRGVVCLISALSFHGLTTQVPHTVHLALVRGSDVPRLEYPPLSLYWFGEKAYSAGIETHLLDSVPVRVYSPEKTIADCFKFRLRIGTDIAVEALKLYWQRGTPNTELLLEYARLLRVRNVMTPYLESMP